MFRRPTQACDIDCFHHLQVKKFPNVSIVFKQEMATGGLSKRSGGLITGEHTTLSQGAAGKKLWLSIKENLQVGDRPRKAE